MGRTEAASQGKGRRDPISIKDLRSLRTLLIQPKNEEGTALRSHLDRIGCRVDEAWPPPSSYPEELDVVFVMIDRVVEEGMTFHWQVEDPPAVLIAVIDYESPLSIDRLLRIRANTVIGLPIRPFGILTNLLVAVNSHRREQYLTEELSRMQYKMQTCRTVERAKLALMLTNSQSEQEAYTRLRKLAMQRRTTVDIISEEILSSVKWHDDEAAAPLEREQVETCSP